MIGRTGAGTALAIVLVGFGATASAQPPPPGPGVHGHGTPAMFLAQLDAGKVVPAATSSATATGAFVVDPAKRTIAYDLTFHGLERGAPRSIALHNFGAGGNGPGVHILCGTADRPCPSLPSANLTGTWDGRGRPELDSHLLGELASARVYVEITGGDGKAELRGQLEPNGAMVPVKNFVAHLAPVPGADARAVGTAVLSEVHFPDGQVTVFYQVTVAGVSGPPTNAALVGVPAPSGPAPLKLVPRNMLPRSRIVLSRTPSTGGTITGEYQTHRKQADPVLATRLLATGSRQIAIAVSTNRFPNGELYGVFTPVQ